MGRTWPLLAVGLAAVTAATSVCDSRSDCAAESNDESSLLQRSSAPMASAQRRSLTAPEFWPLPRTLTVPPNVSADKLGIVDELYTYGAPGTAAAPLVDMQHSGTFPGVRVYTEDVWGAGRESKWIDAAAIFNTLRHARIATLVLRWGEASLYEPGAGHPEWPLSGAAVYAHWPLHGERNYRDRLRAVTLQGQNASNITGIRRASFFARLAWKTYDNVENTKKALAEDFPGWKLAAFEVLVNGKHTRDEDPVLLIQHQDTLECALAFTGTNDMAGELSTSTQVTEANFCGFEGVHKGYRNELWHITKFLWPALSPRLAKCSRVSVIGHSLGGSIAEIFSACANSKRIDDPDYAQQMWVKETPQKLPEWGAEPNYVQNPLIR